MTIFIDASFLISLFNKDDEFHKQAKKLAKELSSKPITLITSNIVLAESINVVFRYLGAKNAKKLLNLFYKSNIEEIFVSDNIFKKAYQLLWQQKKKGPNFFDCLHIATMNSFKIKAVLTFDKDFKGQGFKILGLK
jgi:uncharacterized protein